MTSMMERVARAIWEERRKFAGHLLPSISLEEWGDGTFPELNGIMAEARAAIEAMREPTEAMKNFTAANGDSVLWTANCHYCGGPKFTWPAMIDRALAEAGATENPK